MANESVIYDKKDGIATITLNRPAKRNAINLGMRNEIMAALRDAGDDDSVRAVILTGGTEVFCSGVDLTDTPPVTLWQKVSPKRTYQYYYLVEDMGKPVIAAIAGYCLAGGLELACTCDIRIAADNALLGDAHAKAGVFPGGGSTQRLPRLVGIAKAKELIFSGEPISAAEAERIGLVNKVVPTASLLAEARKLAELYKSRPPLVIKLAKAAINDGMQMPMAQGLDYETKCQAIVHTTEDYKEAMTAFKEKRKPVFKGQ
ncbi:MAG: enoyl-CoA hydratase [Betaproteobacteria bacterium]|nr:enoyl-CoA hydratase [Betaproteobacteria bacterium]